MDIKFDKQAVESFINDAAQRAWNNEVQDNAYKQLVLELKDIGIELTPKQEKALKISFNHLGIISTKQSLIAVTYLLNDFGILKLEE